MQTNTATDEIESALGAAPSGAGAAPAFCGALLHDSGRDDEDPVYVLQPLESLDSLLDHPGFILGTTMTDIEIELSRRHPDPYPDCTCLVMGEHALSRRDPRDSGGCGQTWRRRRRWNVHTVKGWRLHKHPVAGIDDLDGLASASKAAGPLLVPVDTYRRLGEKKAFERAGFVVRYEHDDFCLLNYNPRSIERRPLAARKKELAKLLSGQFPQHLRASLFDCLRPAHWPDAHPFDGVVSVESPFTTTHPYRRGKTTTKDKTAADILTLRDLALKLWPCRKWWRKVKIDLNCESTGGNGGNGGNGGTGGGGGGERFTSFHAALAEAVKYIFGVEKHNKILITRQRANIRQFFTEEAADHREDAAGAYPPAPLAQQLRENTAILAAWRALALCRWLRQEARAMKIKIPPQPVMPPEVRGHRPARRPRRPSQ